MTANGKKKPKVWLIVLIVVGALVIAGVVGTVTCISRSMKSLSSAMLGSEAQALTTRDLSQSIMATGTVESQNVVEVTTDLTLKVKELPVSLGDYVEEGDVLCVFDDTQLKEQIATLESQMSTSQKLAAKQTEILNRTLTDAQTEAAKSNTEAAQKTKDAQSAYDAAVTANTAAEEALKVAQLGGDELAIEMAQENALQAAANVETCKEALSLAKSSQESIATMGEKSIQSAQDAVDTDKISAGSSSELSNQLATLYSQLDKVTVYAEQSGIITSINVSQGSIATGTLMRIEDSEHLKVTVSIKEKDILKLTEGMKAIVKADAIPDEDYGGSVTKVVNFSSMSTNALGTTTSSGYSAEISVDTGSKLLLGMTAKVEIVIVEGKDGLAVAYDSIATDEDGTTYVYRANPLDNGLYEVERVDVTVGEEGSYYTGISSKELKEGDLILSEPDLLAEGSQILVYTDSDEFVFEE